MKINQIFADKIKGKKNIIISTHLFPDADGIGSQIGLTIALRKFGTQCLAVNEEPLLERYKYLDKECVVFGFEEYRKFSKQIPDLIIIVDTNTVLRVGKSLETFAKEHQIDILYIDHHPCHKAAMEGHCIDTKAAATGQLVGELIKSIQIPFDQSMALALYTAILIDTSSFRYPTVSASTHKLVSELMETGINPPSAYNGIYGTKKIPHMHLLGKILSSANCNKNQDIAWIYLGQKDLSDFSTDIEDTHAFINHLLILDNIKVACMFRQDGTKLKVSFRSTGEYDVGIIAQKLGGGGHSHSAATIFEILDQNTIQNQIETIINKIEKIMDEAVL
jgi:phosphoesterase RecJ-like protein